MTPRTEAMLTEMAAKWSQPKWQDQPITMFMKEVSDFARQLERELAEARKDAKITRIEWNIEKARNEHYLRHLTHIHMMLLPDRVKLPDGREFEFRNPSIEREMLEGLTKAIREIPDILDAIANTSSPQEKG